MKIFLIVIDGMGDQPVPELGGKTPLEAAFKPNLDTMASHGICGLVNPFLAPGEDKATSEGAHIGLFGYQDYFLGRGPYEATGLGMKLKNGDVALRANFASVNSEMEIIDRRAGRIEKTEKLIDSLNNIKIDGVKFLIKKALGHRAVLVLRPKKGLELSANISKGDPKRVGEKPLEIKPMDETAEAAFTAKTLNAYLNKAHQILKDHIVNQKRICKGEVSANYLLTRGAGQLKSVPSFKERYGLKAACVAGGGLYRGIAEILGMKLVSVRGATARTDTNLKGKISASIKALKKYDFVFCHIKAADSLAEDGKFAEKKKFIEKIDENLFPLLGLKNVLTLITGDHNTSCVLKSHCNDPVPFLLWGGGWDKKVLFFSEKECVKGSMGRFNQEELLRKVLVLKNN
ncbi:MAG: 2,3-bisphosphoglycerate-independent phosphoglycerate mutase [Candidatus Paceibacterota bacterium]|jgi:2,3-bisphosphoglycerate-independent phosphoglycerate mutase|nr:2,3-bisphosphoglycerate-independent phosphoglycerate mutase [Candidatus Paceibacterota bacterium]MDD4831135.1 2,3-bisphosphoglycerate-independent phosphoglycerate mutase [Candidatus Paceibacterota bacterium]MDD4875113.1 2,3-bisphosphoglycerate-independent phosphoglycerate mutase [Candidatus Paceibacterota bacterium]